MRLYIRTPKSYASIRHGSFEWFHWSEISNIFHGVHHIEESLAGRMFGANLLFSIQVFGRIKLVNK